MKRINLKHLLMPALVLLFSGHLMAQSAPAPGPGIPCKGKEIRYDTTSLNGMQDVLDALEADKWEVVEITWNGTTGEVIIRSERITPDGKKKIKVVREPIMNTWVHPDVIYDEVPGDFDTTGLSLYVGGSSGSKYKYYFYYDDRDTCVAVFLIRNKNPVQPTRHK